MKNKIKIAKYIVLTILIAITFFIAFSCILNVCFNLCYIETQVRGHSMLPTINSGVSDANMKGDTIYINKYASVGLNDIVVADVSWHSDYIIKRVVATPGDRLQIKDFTTYYGVYVNSTLLYTRDRINAENGLIKTEIVGYYEKYLEFINNPNNADYTQTLNGEKYIVMPKGEYFLMGDNWGHTLDSIEHGPVKAENLIGKVDAILPKTHINFLTPTWFMLKLIF